MEKYVEVANTIFCHSHYKNQIKRVLLCCVNFLNFSSISSFDWHERNVRKYVSKMSTKQISNNNKTPKFFFSNLVLNFVAIEYGKSFLVSVGEFMKIVSQIKINSFLSSSSI